MEFDPEILNVQNLTNFNQIPSNFDEISSNLLRNICLVNYSQCVISSI